MPALNKLRINGVDYDISGGGGGSAVTSVNGKTGAVTLNASDVGALPSSTPIPDELSDLQDDATHRTVTDTEKATWNGKADTSDIPTKVSDLTNDSGFITGLTVLTYGSSTWNDFITAFNANKVVFVRCGAGTTPTASTKPILAHLVKVDYYNGNPRFAEFRYDDYVDQKTYADQDDHIRIYKLFTDNGWTLTTVPVAPRIVAGDGINYDWTTSGRERSLTLSLDRASITTVSFEVVQTLPSTGEANVIYLVQKSTAQTQNVYDEYIYTNSAWEKIGDTEIDLSGYYSTNDDAETDIAEGDYFPFNDMSDSSKPKKKTLWSNIKAKLKDYFDGIYATISSLATVATSGSYNDLTGKPTLTTTTVGSASTGTAISADDITAWSAGTTPTLGTAISADDITAWDAGSVPTLGTAISADDITGWSAGSAASATASGGVVTFTNGSVPSLTYTARSIPNVTSVGTKPSLSYTARSIPNVTNVGTLPSLSYTARSIPNISVTNKTVVNGMQ